MDSLLEKIRPLCKQTENFLRPYVGLKEKDRLFVYYDPAVNQFILIVDGNTFSSNVRRWGTRFPEAKFLSNTRVHVPATDISTLIISAIWQQEQLHFNVPEDRVFFNYLLARFTAQLFSAKKQAEFKLYEKVGLVDDILAPYQCSAVEGAINSEFYALFMEQGTGKTAVAIRAADLDRDAYSGTQYKVLVVCPKNVCINWELEIEKFSTHDPYVAQMRGAKLNRVKEMVDAIASRRDMMYSIISYEGMSNTLESLCSLMWDLVILDESHFIKNPKTLRFKSSVKLRESCKKRMILTGTPIANHAGDLYTQFEFLEQGMSGFNSYEQFKNFYNRYCPWTGKAIETLNAPLLQERLARISYIIKKKDAIRDLPEKLYDAVECDMSPYQWEVYRKVAKEILVEIENDESDAQIAVNHALTRMLRLAQITAGFAVYHEKDEDGTIISESTEHFDPNPKLDLLVETLKGKKAHEKTIVWSCWVPSILKIKARLNEEGIDTVVFYGDTKDADRQDAVNRFNSDKDCRVFLGNPAAAGVGLNLLGNADDETACDHVIFYSQGWPPLIRSQAEDRSHRRGTKRHVRITDFVVPGSIDLDIRQSALDKRKNSAKIQDVRDILGRILECTTVAA